MATEAETESQQLAEVDADLAELNDHLNRWLAERFLAPETATELNIEDVSGLILWLQQWQQHFDDYGAMASMLAEAGRPALADRLAQIRAEIDKSIATFTEMAAGLIGPGAGGLGTGAGAGERHSRAEGKATGGDDAEAAQDFGAGAGEGRPAS
jgi:hypothetical protein